MSSLVRIPDAIKKEVEELKRRIANGELGEVSEVTKFAAMSDGTVFYQYLIEAGIEAIKPYKGWVKK